MGKRIISVLLVACLVLTGCPVFACSGGSSGGNSGGSSEGGGSNYSPTSDNSRTAGVKSNGPAYVDIKTPAQLTQKWNNIKKMNEAQRYLNHFQRFESKWDFRTFAGQWGIVYFTYQYGVKVVFVPLAAVWQVSKHTSRTTWGLYTGKLDTVYEVNKNSWVGRQVNRFVIQYIK